MLNVLQKILRKIDKDIDAGNTNITEEEALQMATILKEYVRKDTPMSKYQAYTYINTSRATFDNLVKEGKLPAGQKVAGFKELFWYKKDLDAYLKVNKHGNKENN